MTWWVCQLKLSKTFKWTWDSPEKEIWHPWLEIISSVATCSGVIGKHLLSYFCLCKVEEWLFLNNPWHLLPSAVQWPSLRSWMANLWTWPLRSLSSTWRARRLPTGLRPLELLLVLQAAQLSVRSTKGWTCSRGSGKDRIVLWRRLGS